MAKIGKADIERIRSTASRLVEEHHLPGLAVGVVSGEELAFAEGFGYADIESGRPQSPELRQRIGSITKTMVGLCVMALADDGKLTIEDRVEDWLPDVKFSGPAESLALKHLMTHTGGIGEAPNVEDLQDYWSSLWAKSADVPSFSEAYAKGFVIETPPGAKWAYANHGFALLGEIISRIEGKPIEAVLKERIFEPLGMANTDCFDQPHPNLTTGYHRAPGHDELEVMDITLKDAPEETTVDGYNIRGEHAYVRPRAAGAVESSVLDMARYTAALLRKGRGVVRPETFELMTRPHWSLDERLSSMGLTFFLRERFGRRSFGHGGGITGGWNTQLTVFPDDDLAVIVHLNMNYAEMGLVDSKIAQAALNAPDVKPADAPVDAAILASAPGVYQPTPGHKTNFRIVRGMGRVQITARDGRLFLRTRRGPWREGARMARVNAADPTLFALDTGEPEPPLVALALDGSGAVSAVRIERQAHLVRNEGLKPWAP
ncbi:MAG: beta-lactamase family protein [Chloroflexi bacterium]|nr:beta-lactamase family protein [Chloroflexota bacterium]